METECISGLCARLCFPGNAAAKRADLLLLKADPLKSIAAYDAIDMVFLNGNPIPRASLLPVN